MLRKSNKTYEILSDNNTIWICHLKYGNIGRFSIRGVDLHASDDNGNYCINCTHKKPNLSDYNQFKKDLKRLYKINLSDEFLPFWINV